MLLEETRNDIGTECERYTSVVLAPAGNIFVGIGPEKIAEKTAVRDLSQLAKQTLSCESPAGPFSAVSNITDKKDSIETRNEKETQSVI
jgi:hypothetical protein